MATNRSNRLKILRRLAVMWIQTIGGILFLAGVTFLGLNWLGFHRSIVTMILGFWVVLPIVGWYNCGDLVKRLMRCQEPDPGNPEHARLVGIVTSLMPKTGLAVPPPVYISPLAIPNAFATGRTPTHSFIAATEGLFELGLTDAELEGILAHELAHVKSHDVAITSLMAVLGSLFSLIVAQGLPALFASAFSSPRSHNLLDKLTHKVRRQKKGFFAATGGIAGLFLMVVAFYAVSTFARLVSLFVSRCRESHADALAALWTENPCALSSALQKIVLWMTLNSGPDIHTRFLTFGLTPIMFVSAFEDFNPKGGKKVNGGVLAQLGRWWKHLGENHPPVAERLAMLDQMSGGSCPRLH